MSGMGSDAWLVSGVSDYHPHYLPRHHCRHHPHPRRWCRPQGDPLHPNVSVPRSVWQANIGFQATPGFRIVVFKTLGIPHLESCMVVTQFLFRLESLEANLAR